MAAAQKALRAGEVPERAASPFWHSRESFRDSWAVLSAEGEVLRRCSVPSAGGFFKSDESVESVPKLFVFSVNSVPP